MDLGSIVMGLMINIKHLSTVGSSKRVKLFMKPAMLGRGNGNKLLLVSSIVFPLMNSCFIVLAFMINIKPQSTVHILETERAVCVFLDQELLIASSMWFPLNQSATIGRGRS